MATNNKKDKAEKPAVQTKEAAPAATAPTPEAQPETATGDDTPPPFETGTADNSNGGALPGETAAPSIIPLPQPETGKIISDVISDAISDVIDNQDMVKQGVNQYISQLNPDAMVGCSIQYHHNGTNDRIRRIIPGQILQLNNGKPDVLVVFNSTEVMEVTAWFAGDANRNTSEPYWTIPGMN